MTLPGRALTWQLGEVAELVDETPRVKTILLDAPDWAGHRAGQHVDVRLTAEDGYMAERSYSIASAPEDGRLAITVERLDDGEVSPYLAEELVVGDKLEFRGPIGGYFVWEAREGGPLLLVGDSLNQVLAGNETTLSTTLDQMIYHAGAVRRGSRHALVFVDLPVGEAGRGCRAQGDGTP